MPPTRFRYAAPLSLFFIAALVFAPGEQWLGREPLADVRGSDIAARVLAPTVDQGLAGEGRFGRAAPSQERENRGTGRLWAGALLVATFCLLAPTRFFVIRSAAISSLHRYVRTAERRRGPPLLQPA